MNSPQPSSTAAQADKSPSSSPTVITTPPKAKGAAPSMAAVATSTTAEKSTAEKSATHPSCEQKSATLLCYSYCIVPRVCKEEKVY
mmetsp:Transcript_2469/g.5210  ORF Transcript_2469/g.5210 Transcript_2469/m.5210 type:complete len:86 (+) Transcript_2469:303-560(+)